MHKTTEELKKLTSRIEKYRILKNVDRKDIASKLDMTVSGYSKIERGEVDISFNKIVQIAEILDVELQEILNIDQSEIFNISHCNSHGAGVGGAGKVIFNSHPEEKINNYITLLEEEIKRLKEEKKG